MRNKKSGFGYYASREKIKEYQAMPIEKRLLWLYQGNLFRMSYPKEIIEIQEKFRRAII